MSSLHLRDGTRIRYADCRPDQLTREPVVLLHGWKQSHRLFDRLTLCLLRRGHRVLSYDHRGMGDSDKPEGLYTFERYAQDLKEVLEARGVHNATLLGWSMGCTVALEYMRLHGERVSGVILHNGPVRLTQTEDFPHAMPEGQFERYLSQMEYSWPRSEEEFQAGSILNKEDHILLDLLVRVALQTPLGIALKTVKNQALIDHRETIRSLELPLLAVYAERDPYYPSELAQWISLNSSGGTHEILQESAHCAPLEEPENLAEIISEWKPR